MAPKRNKISLSYEMMHGLSEVKAPALVKKRQGDYRQLMQIVLADWKTLNPECRTIVRSLKVCLSKIAKVGSSRNKKLPLNNDSP